MIDRSIIELNAHVFAPQLYFFRGEVCAVIGDNAVGDTVTVYDPGHEVYYRSGFGRLDRRGFYPFGEFIHHDQQVFFLVGSAFKGSHHIEPPDRKRPSDGDSSEGVGWHMALVGKELATDAPFD